MAKLVIKSIKGLGQQPRPRRHRFSLKGGARRFARQKSHLLVILQALAATICSMSIANAHEFWVAPDKFQISEGNNLSATLRVGRMMKGSEFPYLAENFESFTVTIKGEVNGVLGRNGDLPALNQAAEPGLNVIAYHARAAEVVYNDWPTFQRYLRIEGLTEIEALHRRRDLPESGFTESYRRYAKSLVQVGPASPSDVDAAVGAPFELVAMQNPYQEGLKAITVRLLRHGEPVKDRQIAVFRNDGEVIRRLVFTDENGEATIEIAGGGSFLLNATDLQPADDGDVVWESYWASLTFGLPITDGQLHPLDPLTKSEIARAIGAIGRSGRASRTTRVSLLTLDEPEKAEVLQWTPGADPQRRAFAVLRNGSSTDEVVVDLTSAEVISWIPRPGVQPAIQSAEWALAQRLTKEDPRWLTAMSMRGYEDPAQIFCESLSVGRFEERAPPTRQLKTVCFDISDAVTNVYARPIEGVVATIDLDNETVIDVEDAGQVEVASASGNFDEASVDSVADPMRPVVISAPLGWNFKQDGNFYEWGAWRFHLGFDQRFGPVISLVTHQGETGPRSVLHQGHLSEVFVPYMDDGAGWFFRAYMDAGEFGVGAYASPLAKGRDCPSGAEFVDAVMVTRLGAPRTSQRAMCVFERPAQSPLWRHYEALGQTHESRHATELVVRSIPTVGNYDYVIDWVFTLAGEIAIQVGATGIDAVKGVSVSSMEDLDAETATSGGMLVAPNLVAVNHDHYFSFRLDLDIDGPVNRPRRQKLTAVRAKAGSPRKSLWRLEPVPATVEFATSMRSGPEVWSIENPAKPTDLGHAPGYQIQVGSSATSLLSADDWLQRRAGFTAKTLWLTRQRRGERFAAGPYPNQSDGSGGLPALLDGESVVSEDVVAWTTLGFHHVTRPEDWPILPTLRHEIRLRPYGFFSQNPGIGVRREFSTEDTKN